MAAQRSLGGDSVVVVTWEGAGAVGSSDGTLRAAAGGRGPPQPTEREEKRSEPTTKPTARRIIARNLQDGCYRVEPDRAPLVAPDRRHDRYRCPLHAKERKAVTSG